MYGNYLDEAAKIVAEKRAEDLKFEHVRLTADEKDQLLKEYHPDRIASQFVELKIGPNKGQKAPIELAEMLQAKPRLEPEKIDLSKLGKNVTKLSFKMTAHNTGVPLSCCIDDIAVLPNK